MTQAELQKVLRAADEAAVLVSSRILERVIREDCRLPNMYWKIPHFKSYVCDRQALFRHAEQADLELEPDQLLPETVILLVRPDAEELSNLERRPLLLKYWRRLFHARVHMALGVLRQTGQLDDQAVRKRIEIIGRTEFEEIREVLTEDRYLVPGASDLVTYIEFAAVYLEMRQFAGSLLTNYFPGIRDFGRIEQMLDREVNAADLFKRTRLKDAADPILPVDTRGDESLEAYWKLVRGAQKAALVGNTVGAAIQRMRASRIAPAALTLTTRQEAEKDIALLSKRLSEALKLSMDELLDWTRHLTLLLDKADQGTRPMEARVLDDLQKVCEDHEEEIYTLDLVEFVLSGGKRPIKRPLPSQRLVRIASHLRSAVGKLATIRLSDVDRGHLDRLLTGALARIEEGLQARFRPVLITALQDVGLKPATPPQQAAFEKMIAELLDRIGSYGYLTFAELRDTISRNQLKLPDLTEPEDFIRGDPLIRLDRRLGSLLDGVYRPGEFYVRWLERFTSLKFGTVGGRLLTRWVTLPFGAAWVLLFLVGTLLTHLFSYQHFPDTYTVGLVLMGPAHARDYPNTPVMTANLVAGYASPDRLTAVRATSAYLAAQELARPPNPSIWWHVVLLACAGLFMLGLFESERFRARFRRGLRTVWRGTRHVLVTLPLGLIPLTTIRRIIKSSIFQFFWWGLIKPATICLVIRLFWPEPFEPWFGWLLIFVLVLFLLNSRVGRATSEALEDGLARLGELVRAGLLPGLFHFIVYVFKQVSEAIDYVLFVADEWLRYRKGDSRWSLVVRTVASVVWAPVAFFVRFFMVVLIEPGYNPLKAPVSYLAAKIMAPMTFYLMKVWLPEFVAPWPWPLRIVGGAFLFVVIFHLCDVFGFLFWEMKENWSLYRSNRGKKVRPVAVGAHGETIRGFLQPGFHSGTIPRLYGKLRVAERRALQTRNWNTVRGYRHEMKEVGEAVRRFVSREMLTLLGLSRAWRDQKVKVGSVYLSTNRIRLELEHMDHPALGVELEIEHRRGWLVAGIATRGWLGQLSAEQLRVFTACLAYLYKRADVDLVREQVLANLPGKMASLQLTDGELLAWPEVDGKPLRYALSEGAEQPGDQVVPPKMVFDRMPLTWELWDDSWRKEQQGEGFPGLPEVDDDLVPAPSPDVSSRPDLNLEDGYGPLDVATVPREENLHGEETTQP